MGRGLDGFFVPSPMQGTRDTQWLLVQFSRPVEGLGLSPFSGGFSEGETPLPIPNRAVKPLSADGTWPARAWESRTPPVYLRKPPQKAAFGRSGSAPRTSEV